MSQKEVRNSGILLGSVFVELMHVSQNGEVTVMLSEISKLGFVGYGLAVSQMVVTDYVESLRCHECGEPVIAVDEFHHAVGDLKYRSHLAFRYPFYSVYLCKAVL